MFVVLFLALECGDGDVVYALVVALASKSHPETLEGASQAFRSARLDRLGRLWCCVYIYVAPAFHQVLYTRGVVIFC
jgi:hypothetical protein